MNTIYRIIWNATTGTWVVASEFAKGRTKQARRKTPRLAALALGGVILGSGMNASADLLVQENAGSTTCMGKHDDGGGSWGTVNSTGCQYTTGAKPDASDVLIYANGGSGSSENSIAIGGNLTVGSAATFYGGIDMKNSKIFNLGPGTLSSTSTEAVNGSQLFATNENVAANTADIAALDGRVTTTEGNVTTLQGDVTQLSTDLTTIDGRVATVEGNVSQLTTQLNDGSIGLVQQDAASRAITVAKDTDGTLVSLTGTAGDRTLAGVKAGALTADSTEAVNGSQLFATNENVAANTADIAALDGRVTTAEGNVTTLQGDVTQLSTDLTTLDGRVTTTENNVTTLQGDITQLNTNVTALDGRLTTVEGDVTNLTTQLNDGTVGLVQQDATSRRITVANESDGDVVDVTGTAGARTITGVKAGAVSAASTDAINGSQLHGTAGSIAAALGGGASVDADGKVTAPSYSVDGTTVNSVGDAISNIDQRTLQNTSNIATHATSITQLQQQMGDVTTGAIGLVQQNATTRGITVAKDTDGDVVSVTGTAGDRTITGVKAGVADHDAVNVSQLKQTGLIDADGNAMSALVYDTAAKDVVTLGGKGATTPVKLKNVADAEEDTDAVNLHQLKQTGLVGNDGAAMDAVVYDAGSAKGVVTFGGVNGTLLTNVHDGNIAIGSREAVNGGQMAALRDSLQNQIATLDGRVTNVDNRVGAIYGGGSGSGGAGSTAGGGLLGGNASGEDSVALGNGAQASGDTSVALGKDAAANGSNSVALGAGSIADRDNTVSVGSAGHERQVAYVADGTAPTDAVNLRQMQRGDQETLSSANAYADQRLQSFGSQMDDRFHMQDRRIDEMGAMGSAMTSMAASVAGIASKNRVGVGAGNVHGRSALAVGYQRALSPRANFTLGGAFSGNDRAITAGVGLGW